MTTQQMDLIAEFADRYKAAYHISDEAWFNSWVTEPFQELIQTMWSPEWSQWEASNNEYVRRRLEDETG